ncbi:Palmitoyl-protein thioesterase 1 [Glycine max]|nr:Palmitoyl-protein thioesterase 1 [Glycine max]
MALPSLSFLFIFSVSHSIPFIVIHGIGDQCSNRGVKKFTQQLSSFSGAEGYFSLFLQPVGNGSWDSWFKPLKEQAEIVCEKVKQVKELKEGYNIVGLSQVKNFISLGGPHTGTASVPICGVSTIVAFQHGALYRFWKYHMLYYQFSLC